MKHHIIYCVLSILLVSGCNGQVKEKTESEQNSIQKMQKQSAETYANKAVTAERNNFNFRVAAQKATPAVVHIKTTFRVTADENLPDFFRDFFGDVPKQSPNIQSGIASGVILTSNGYIVTNNHVVEDAENIEIILHDQRKYNAKIIGKDPSTDLALLKINETNLSFIQYGNTDSIEVGDFVLAVGNPFNLASTVTAGIVSAKARNINILNDRFAVESYIQTDAAVNRGNSGGALVDMNGNLIGINSAISTPTGVYAGYAFAIPIEIVKKVIDDLLKFGKVIRGYLGVTIRDVDADIAQKMGVKVSAGVLIDSVEINSAALKAGIKPKDIIIKLNGQNVTSANQVRELINRHQPGDKIVLTIFRNGNELTIPVVLMPLSELSKEKIAENNLLKLLGIEVENISIPERDVLNIKGGVKVVKISRGIIARQTNIQEGFIITSVNKNKVNNVDEFIKQLSNNKGGVLLEGKYTNSQGTYYYAFGF